MASTYGYTKVGPETYEVARDGEVLGKIYVHSNGKGWTINGLQSFGTREEAARHLFRQAVVRKSRTPAQRTKGRALYQ